jgi:hypothetical protein
LGEEPRAAEGEGSSGEGRGLERGAAGDFHGAATISDGGMDIEIGRCRPDRAVRILS